MALTGSIHCLQCCDKSLIRNTPKMALIWLYMWLGLALLVCCLEFSCWYPRCWLGSVLLTSSLPVFVTTVYKRPWEGLRLGSQSFYAVETVKFCLYLVESSANSFSVLPVISHLECNTFFSYRFLSMFTGFFFASALYLQSEVCYSICFLKNESW